MVLIINRKCLCNYFAVFTDIKTIQILFEDLLISKNKFALCFVPNTLQFFLDLVEAILWI